MMRYVSKTFIIAATVVGLSACAVDPVTDHVSGGTNGGPVLADALEAPQTAMMIIRVARSTEKRGELPTAVALYRRALSIHSESFEAASGLATVLSRLGAHDEATDAWRIALKLRPNDTEALRGMGNTLVASGRPAMAVPHYERGLAIKPESRLYNGIGVAHDMLNDYNAAQAYYRVGLKTDKKNLSMHNNLGLSFLLSGKIEQAVTELKQAVGHPEAGTKHRMNLALALVRAGDTDSALSIARMDLGARDASDQIAYFETIHALGDSPAARQAIQAHIRGSLDQRRGGTVVRPVGGFVTAR